jgi:hypothetical protein
MARRTKIIAGSNDVARHARGDRPSGTSHVVGNGAMKEHAMTEGEMIIQGLKEALAYSRGDKSVGKSRRGHRANPARPSRS